MTKFAKIAIVSALFAAFGAANATRPAGAPTFTVSSSANSVTINGTVYTAPVIGEVKTPAQTSKSYYTGISFDSDKWLVSGGKYMAGGTTTNVVNYALSDLTTWVSDVNTAIANAVQSEVDYIQNTLVANATSAITTYNNAAVAGNPPDAASSTVNAAVAAVYDEVNGTRNTVTTLRSLNVRVNAAQTAIVIDSTKSHNVVTAANQTVAPQ